MARNMRDIGCGVLVILVNRQTRVKAYLPDGVVPGGMKRTGGQAQEPTEIMLRHSNLL
jgi:hypothetical protein